MSLPGVRWAWAQRVSGTARRVVLVALGDTHQEADSQCFTSMQRLAEMAATNKARVKKILEQLQSDGLIKIQVGHGRRANRYILVGIEDFLVVPHGAPQSDEGGGGCGAFSDRSGAFSTRSGAPVGTRTYTYAQREANAPSQNRATYLERKRAAKPPRPQGAIKCRGCDGSIDGCFFCDFRGWTNAGPTHPTSNEG